MLKLYASSFLSFADLTIGEVVDIPPSDHLFAGLCCVADAQRFQSRSLQ